MAVARSHRLFGPLLLGTGLTTLKTASAGTVVLVKGVTVSNTASVARVFTFQITPSGGIRDTIQNVTTGLQNTSQLFAPLPWVLNSGDTLHINAIGTGLVVAVFGSILDDT